MSKEDKFVPPPQLDTIGRRAEGNLAQNFRREIAHLLQRGGNLNFPGAQPVSFARKHLEELKKRDYYVCEKSDGIRCLLYCTSDNGREIHYLIDRKNEFYYIEGLHLPIPPRKDQQGRDDPNHDWAAFHEQTLLDGELLVDKERNGTHTLKYLVFDCLVMDGQDIMQRSLDKRLAFFIDMVHKPYTLLCKTFPQDTERFKFRIEQKSFQFAYGAEMMFKQILPALRHGNDGLIFTCRETPYKFGTDEHILKWKPARENTIDFKLELSFPQWQDDDESTQDDWQYDYDAMPDFGLHVGLGEDKIQWFATMYATPLEWDKMKLYAIAQQDGLDGAIVECYKDDERRWRYHRFRDDKRDANHITTVQKVLESIEDAVAEEELIGCAGDIRARWKARAAAVERAEKERVERERVERDRVEKEKRAKASAGHRAPASTAPPRRQSEAESDDGYHDS